MNPVYISIGIGLLWSLANGLWTVFLVHMEAKLMEKFVSRQDCAAHRVEADRRFQQVGV